MMRPTSRFHVNSEAPRARGVCERCGKHWQHSVLTWQHEWIGPRLQNLRQLVCPECYDTPQQNRRTIVLPPDPVPIMNARPENYVADDNPLSGIGVSANFNLPQYGSRIGNLTGSGGINAAFDGTIEKLSWLSATNKTISNSSFNNYIGINWEGNVSNLAMPSSMLPPVLSHTLTAVNIYAPIDTTFLKGTTTSYLVQASPVDTAGFGAWTTVASGTTTGVPGESIKITSISPNPRSQFHRVAFLGDAVNYISVAQVQFSVGETGGNYNGI
jgi:hypothetical protein